jgi:DNA-binding response OmpR family regulator
LIYKTVAPSPNPIQVGTFLAFSHFEEGTWMTESHLRANKSTIMVVDDNQDMVDLIKAMLEAKGYGVQSANSGQEAFNLLEERKPDLIILDVMMPEMDGLEVLRRLKGAQETSSIPVIMLTALDKPEDKLAGYKMGADDYLTKPFKRIQLMTGINSLLNGDQAHL